MDTGSQRCTGIDFYIENREAVWYVSIGWLNQSANIYRSVSVLFLNVLFYGRPCRIT